jgi:acyl-CoA thioester hydrolase
VGLGASALLKLSVLWVVRRHDIEYLLPAFEGDELEAYTWAQTLSGATSQRRTLFKRAGKVAARADTKWVMIDATSHGPVRVPASISAAYGF